MRWADSDSRIWRSLDGHWGYGWSSEGGSARLPQPRSTPRLSVGHRVVVPGQRSFARDKILSVVRWPQSRSILCSRDSGEWLQLELLKSHMHLTQYVDQVCIRCSSVKVTLCPLTSSVDGVRTCTTPSTHISVDLVIIL